MRGFLVLIVTAVLCFMAYKYMSNREENLAPPRPASSEGSGAPSEAGAAVARPGASATPAGAAATATGGGPGGAGDVRARLEEAARKVGVTVAKLEEKGAGSVVVTVEWEGDVASLGGDFVEEVVLTRKIARRFDSVAVAQPMWMDAQGKRHFRAAFDLKF